MLTHPRERSVYDARIEPLRGFFVVSYEELSLVPLSGLKAILRGYSDINANLNRLRWG